MALRTKKVSEINICISFQTISKILPYSFTPQPPTTSISPFLPSLSMTCRSVPSKASPPSFRHTIFFSILGFFYCLLCKPNFTFLTSNEVWRGPQSCATPCPLKKTNKSKFRMHRHECEVAAVLKFRPISPAFWLGSLTSNPCFLTGGSSSHGSQTETPTG